MISICQIGLNGTQLWQDRRNVSISTNLGFKCLCISRHDRNILFRPLWYCVNRVNITGLLVPTNLVVSLIQCISKLVSFSTGWDMNILFPWFILQFSLPIMERGWNTMKRECKGRRKGSNRTPIMTKSDVE